ncbi:MAG: serine hydrolase [Candidatus Zixiibacteriota bacterium]
MKLNRFVTSILIVLLLTSWAIARNPQETWEQYKSPEEAGWSSEKLEQAKELYDSLDAAAFMVVYDGKVLVSWGDVKRRFMCHSVRKSLLSALYGTHVDDGSIDLNKTLAELNIDDKSPLTETEKQATIRDLLKARSGVYHPAAYETQSMKARRPKRGSHPRDTFWYYNNWDFNTLGTIFEQETGADIFEDFENRIADPLQMEDFRLMDGYHHLEAEHSIHPAYPFRMSARDMARFGLLYLQEGKWNDKQVISKEWTDESTRSYSETDDRGGGYGYLWWMSGEFKELGMYSAYGVGTQVISVLPGADLVIVQRVDTYQGRRTAPNSRLFNMILDARVSEPKPDPELIALQNSPSYQRPEIIHLEPSVMEKYVREYTMGETKVSVKKTDGKLLLDSPGLGKFHLLPVSGTKFVVQDAEYYAIFEFDDNGTPFRLTLHETSATGDLYSTIIKKGIEAAIEQYREMKRNETEFSESALNTLGYQLLGIKKSRAAIEIFKLNVEAYPESFNVYDSLGEAYMMSGEDSLAVESYRRSLELNPENVNAQQMIDKIKKKR